MPLLSFVLCMFFVPKSISGKVAVSSIAVSFIASCFVFFKIWNAGNIHIQHHWFTLGQTSWDVGLLLNNLSALMILLVSGIAFLVHIYSLAYMKGDENIDRYWGYLSLFCSSMLGLVIADNLLLIYIFWELVGFSSYLLIGFWRTRDAAVQANKKAFIMNRLGDLGFLLALMILYSQFGTLDIEKLFGDGGLFHLSQFTSGEWIAPLGHISYVWLLVCGFGFVFGALAKSAQFPLHTWLPDAMEGPTAVSSLIHAATMVAAGVFLLVRVSPIFDSTVLITIAVIGIFTAFMASTIALVQNDIKRILAYSTISQLGFMMLAIGIGNNGAAIFHLATHAFFKCLLFLCAGSVIHEMHYAKNKLDADCDHQDIRNMGGLRKMMPLTFVTMVIAALALCGIPLTSGYLSKDAILISSFEWATTRSFAAKLIPYLAMLTSWLTTFYIARLIFKVFYGELRIQGDKTERLIHEAPRFMLMPQLFLAVCSAFFLFSVNPLSYENTWLLKVFPGSVALERIHSYHTVIPALLNLFAVLIIYFAYIQYARKEKAMFRENTWLYNFALNGWYFDEFYHQAIVRPVTYVSKFSFSIDRKVIDGLVDIVGKSGVLLSSIAGWLDRKLIDGFVNLAGRAAAGLGNFFRSFQSGRIQYYLAVMIFVVLTFFVLRYFSPAI
ncbi:NADH-quinone oxidoreductase subunit L [Pedobacter sp. HMF7647]|uniref:NADH-quinone oxidoreductase subunit L n=2 Tax=Hufsiella arboris TaxID=2695275 RepID=A0A7K1Y9Z3_9SPHI|nr:NADH-quinone oxidoreductase subunit L [Hufsiella arboris]